MDPFEVTFDESESLVFEDTQNQFRSSLYSMGSTLVGIIGMNVSEIPAVSIASGIIAASSIAYGFFKIRCAERIAEQFENDPAKYLKERHGLGLGDYELRLDN